MSAQQPEITMDLLGKYLAGEASPEEAAAIDDWRSKPENTPEFDKLLNLYNKLSDSEQYTVPSTEHQWEALRVQIQQKATRHIIPRWMGYAAACIICMIGFAMYIINSKNTADDVQNTIVREAKQIPLADTLPDGSTVTINKGSTIRYDPTFISGRRELQLQGECYFNITSDPKNPFTIHVSGLIIQVLGTSFNVKQIDDGKTIVVQVSSGIVKMSTALKELKVSAGETGIYNVAEASLERLDTLDRNSVSYATKSFYFTDISLEEACKYLQEAFNVEIRVYKKGSARCRLTAQFIDKPLDYILEVIDATLGSKSQRVGSAIELHAESCE